MASKRKKSFYKGSGSGKHYKGAELQLGAVGYIFSIAKDRERQAKAEAFDLLNSYAAGTGDQDGIKSDSESNSEEDIQAAMEKQLAKLKEKKQPQSKFSFQDTGVNQIMFMKTSLENHYNMTYSILADAKKGELKTKSRYLNRIVPVLASCRAEPEKIRECVLKAVNVYLASTQVPSQLTYKSQIKVRNNTDKELSQTKLISVVGEVMRDDFSDWKVNLSDPSVYIMVDILKTVCCVSVIHDYLLYKKFNLQELIVSYSTGKAAESRDNRVSMATNESSVNSSHGNAETDVEKLQTNLDVGSADEKQLTPPADSKPMSVVGSQANLIASKQDNELGPDSTTDHVVVEAIKSDASLVTGSEIIKAEKSEACLMTDPDKINSKDLEKIQNTKSGEDQNENSEKLQTIVTETTELRTIKILEPDTAQN